MDTTMAYLLSITGFHVSMLNTVVISEGVAGEAFQGLGLSTRIGQLCACNTYYSKQGT